MERPLLLRKHETNGETESDTRESDGFTAEMVIESMKWGRLHYIILFIAGLFCVTDALEVMLLTVLFPAVQCEWQLSSLESAMLSMLVFAGMLCGAPLWGMLCDKYGRKPITYLTIALVAYIGFLCSFSPNITWLLILRFLVGAAISGSIHMSVLMIEFLGYKYRAVMIVAAQGYMAIGALLEVLLAWMIIPTIGWRYLVAVSSLPLLLTLFTWPLVPESARFLLISGQMEKAKQVLAKVAEMNRCILPPGELRAEVVEERGRIADLFHPAYRRTTLLLVVIWATSIAASYGSSLATTELLSMNYCAAPSATASLDAKSSSSCGCSPLSSSDYGQIALTCVAGLLTVPIIIVLVELIGRRNSMTLYQTVAAISFFLLLTCVGSTWGVTVMLLIVRGFSGSVSTVLYLYTPEVYPTQCRAVGLSCCFIAGRIGAILTPLFSQVLLRASVHSALSLYGVLSTVGAIASFFLPIETKGRRME